MAFLCTTIFAPKTLPRHIAFTGPLTRVTDKMNVIYIGGPLKKYTVSR